MPARTRLRAAMGLLFLIGVGLVFTLSPIMGVSLLMFPILWTVLVIWAGSESGVGFGPYSRMRDTAFGYVVRFLWQATRATRLAVVLAVTCLVLGGLGWMSTDGLRAKATEPTLASHAADLASQAAHATKETAGNWFETTKGWLTFGEEDG